MDHYECLDMQTMSHIVPYKKYEHTGLHPYCLRKILEEPEFFFRILSRFLNIIQHAPPRRRILFFGFCTYGKHRSVGGTFLLFYLAHLLKIQPLPKPQINTTSVRWASRTCGKTFLCPTCHEVSRGSGPPQDIIDSLWALANRSLQ